MISIARIESEVPFGHTIHVRLALHDLQVDRCVRHNRMETHYLAWETVRKGTNPYFVNGTGFEGYLIGRCDDTEAALQAVIEIGQDILNAIGRSYRYRAGLQSRLMRTLFEDTGDNDCVQIWAAYLGAELAKLRAQILQNPHALAFRGRTYEIVDTLPPIVYLEGDGTIYQSYEVGIDRNPHVSKVLVTPSMLTSRQREAWQVAETIGCLGHPLVREFLIHGFKHHPA